MISQDLHKLFRDEHSNVSACDLEWLAVQVFPGRTEMRTGFVGCCFVQCIEASAIKQVDERKHTLVLHFGSDDCCEVEWMEFFL